MVSEITRIPMASADALITAMAASLPMEKDGGVGPLARTGAKCRMSVKPRLGLQAER